MKNINYHNFFIHSLILIIFIAHSNAQPECHVNRFPEVLPLQFGQEASINLQQYIWGANITYSVQPNDFHSNMQPQYTCKRIWSHRLGKIISTQNYQLKLNNKTELYIAMLGGSSYYNDLYMVYYGIKATSIENNDSERSMNKEKQSKLGFQYKNQDNSNSDSEDQVLVLQVPRYKLKDCKRFVVNSNETHAEFILDCMSPSSKLNKIIATTVISLNQPQPINPQWVMFQSPIYLPEQLIPTLNITSSISVIQTSNKMKYLVRMIMTEYADYIQVWRWTGDGKEIIGIYDNSYFMDQGSFATNDIDLRKMQSISTTILIMDLMNGLHVLQLSKTGKLLYHSTLEMDTFSTFHYDSKQQLLFMAKRGIIQQFQIKIFSSTHIRANRVNRYHLYGFEEIDQIVVQNRYLYVSTELYLHVIHLTNIPSNDQQYDGSYNVYRQLYNQMIVPLVVGFIKVDAAQANVEIAQCETHPPFLHLKAPEFKNAFTVNAVSMVNGISASCTLQITTMTVQADDDRVYANGYESQNQTIYSNRPGRTIMDLDKYAIGKNLQYQITLYNHQIQFDYKIRKVNNQSCQIKLQSTNYNHGEHNNNHHLSSSQYQQLKASNITKTFSVGNWLIVDHPEDRVKQYYKCERYSIIQCNFIQIAITPAAYKQSVYQLLEQQRTKKESILEAVLFQQNNQFMIEVVMVSQEEKKLSSLQEEDQQQKFYLIRTLCGIKFPSGDQYKIGEIKLRQDKLYVVLPNLKQIRIYEALLSFQQNQQCHYFGNLSLSSFKSNGLYFAPRHIDFDKHSLGRSYQMPVFAFQYKTKMQSISQSVETIFITQFNQVLVVRLTISSVMITRIQLLKQLTLDRTTQANDIQLIVTLPNILAIDKTQKTIAQYYVSHTFDRTFVRNYPFWRDNITNSSNDGSIRLIDSNTFAVMAMPDKQNNLYAQVYQIDSVVSSFKEFAKFKIDGAFHIMNFNENQYEFVTARLQQTATTLQLICNSTTLTPSPYAQIQILKPKNDEQPSKQQFFLSSFTLEDSRRQVVTLQVASDSSDIQKGTNYPYTTYTLMIQEGQNQAYYQIDDLNWFSGNIWSHRYVCNDCKTGRITFQNKISLKEKIQLQAFNYPNDFYVTKTNSSQQQQQSYNFQTIEGYLLTKMTPKVENSPWLSVQNSLKERFSNGILSYDAFDDDKKNITYTFSQSFILSSNIENDPKCIKSSPQDHELYFVSMCSDYEFLDESALIELRLYSTTGFKSFVIHQYLIQIGDLTETTTFNLKAGTKSQKQLIVMSSSLDLQQAGNYDTVFVRFDDNIWIFLIVNGKLQLLYTVDKVDFGPNNHLCWIEVIKRKINLDSYYQNSQSNDLNKTITQYGVIASMCESGLYHIVFTVDPPKAKASDMLKTQKQPLPFFHLLTQQQIDMQFELQRSRIQLPQHSYFLQTVAKPIQNETNQFELHMIVSNFNSFIWKVSLMDDTLIVSGMQLIGIIRRYNEYSPIQVTSHDDRYFSVLYKSTQNVNVSEFLAMYDTKYFVINEQKQIKEYEIFSVYKTNDSPTYNNKSEVFQIGNNLFIMRQNQIKIFQVDNLIKMRVQKKMPKQVLQSIELSEQKRMIENRKVNNDKINRLSLTFEECHNDKSAISKTIPSLKQSDQQYPILYSQSIVIFVQTPTQVNSATIKLYSVDYFELSGWIIALIVLGGVLVLGLLYYGLSGLWRYYQKRRKLVKLETQLLDEASSSERDSHDHERRDSKDFDGEEGQHRPQGRQSQITTEQGMLTKSLLEKYRQFQPEQEHEKQKIKENKSHHLQDQNQENDQNQQQTRNEEESEKVKFEQ